MRVNQADTLPYDDAPVGTHEKVSRRAVSTIDTLTVGCLAGTDEMGQGRRSPQQGKASQHCWQSGLAIDRPSRRIVDLHGAIGCKPAIVLLSK